MSQEVKEIYERFKKQAGRMQQLMPDMTKSFQGFFGTVMKDGALDVKTKELIALSLGLAARCEPCIYLHVQKAVEVGASREEVLEAASVAVVMQGGPAFTHIPAVIEALDALGA